MKAFVALVAFLAAANSIAVPAEDVLFSKRLQPPSKSKTSRRSSIINARGHGDKISFFHVNDVHAHLDQYTKAGADCGDPTKGCYGGYARIKTKVDELRAQHPSHLWLNAGDEFQGTLFYTFYGGEKIADTLNQLKFDAMTLGNHEWDGGDEKLGAFLRNLTFPVVSSNVKSEYEALNQTIKNYHIFDKHGLAVIGATTPTTAQISHVGNLTHFLDPIQEVQKAIWEIRNTTNIKRIVALTHIGYEADQQLAAQTEGLSLIIGGHSHTLLGDMPNALGKYPTIVEDLAGNEVFVVTSYRWGEYLGSIDVTFDCNGKALSYRGAPIHMDNTTSQDAALQAQIDEWRKPFDEFSKQVIGTTKNVLDQTGCQKGDCLLGEVMADAMLEYQLNLAKGSPKDQRPDFALLNAGGVRVTIDAGNITRGQVLTAFPFGNAVTEVVYSGSDVRKILEGSVSKVNQFNNQPLNSWIQVSGGISIEYHPANQASSKLGKVTIGDQPLDDARSYRIITVDFVAMGGDNILPKKTDLVTLDTLDKVLVDYITAHTPLDKALEPRIVALGQGNIAEMSASQKDLQRKTRLRF